MIIIMLKCYEEDLMIMFEGESILEMINNKKISQDFYKTPISVDFDGIYAPVEGISVTLQEEITKFLPRQLYQNVELDTLHI